MNISAYFLLAASAILVVVSQQSTADAIPDSTNKIIQQGLDTIKSGFNRGNNREGETIKAIQKSSKENRDNNVFPDATNKLEKGYIEGTKLVAVSEDTILGSLKAAESIVSISSEAAKILLQQGFKASLVEFFASAIPVFESIGAAVGLSNEAAREGLGNASKYNQEVGYAVQEAFIFAESLFVQGINSGSKADQLLIDAVRLAVESSFASAYENIQQSIQVADRALRNAQNAPKTTIAQGQIRSGNCTVAERDPEASEALKAIDRAANTALKRGAKAELVEKFRQVLKCSLGDFVIVIAAFEKNVHDIRKSGDSYFLDAQLSFVRQAELCKKGIVDFSAVIYSYLGEIALKSDNEYNPAIGAFITGFEAGKSKIYEAIRAAGDFIVFGLRYQGDALDLAVEASETSGYFGKSAFIQAFKDVSVLVFNIL